MPRKSDFLANRFQIFQSFKSGFKKLEILRTDSVYETT